MSFAGDFKAHGWRSSGGNGVVPPDDAPRPERGANRAFQADCRTETDGAWWYVLGSPSFDRVVLLARSSGREEALQAATMLRSKPTPHAIHLQHIGVEQIPDHRLRALGLEPAAIPVLLPAVEPEALGSSGITVDRCVESFPGVALTNANAQPGSTQALITPDIYLPASCFPKGMAPRLRMAARPDRRTKRVRTRVIDGVVCYRLADARMWWPHAFRGWTLGSQAHARPEP